MSAGRNEGLIKNFKAGASTITPYRFVKFGADEDTVILGAAATDNILGISYVPIGFDYPIVYGAAEPDLSIPTGRRLDVVMGLDFPIIYGGTVGLGAWLTCDANGAAVALGATPAANTVVCGRALKAGASGSLGVIWFNPQLLRTTA
jgi:hypothetical protein